MFLAGGARLTKQAPSEGDAFLESHIPQKCVANEGPGTCEFPPKKRADLFTSHEKLGGAGGDVSSEMPAKSLGERWLDVNMKLLSKRFTGFNGYQSNPTN